MRFAQDVARRGTIERLEQRVLLAANEIEQHFPADAVVNIKAEFNLAGDGVTDDTDGLTAAVTKYSWSPGDVQKATQPLYLPNGTYLVSDSFMWQQKLPLFGESTTGTVIKLKDNCSGFTDAANPKYVWGFGDDQQDNYGAGFYNYLIGVTIDVGSGNAGAVGINFYGDNQSAIRDVIVRSSDPNHAGYAGIRCRSGSGPAMIKNITIDGFQYGIKFAGGPTWEHITLQNQTVVGISNYGEGGTGVGGPIFTCHDLVSNNSVAVFDTNVFGASVTIVDGTFTGGAPGNTAITSNGATFVRNVTSSGYGSIINDTWNGRTVGTNYISEYASETYGLFNTGTPRSLNLPIEDAPPLNLPDPSTWVSVKSFGADPDEYYVDDTAAIQAAIDSGASVVYFPKSTGHTGSKGYEVRDTIHIRGNVQYLIGFWTGIKSETGIGSKPVFSVENTTAPFVWIDRINGGYWPSNNPATAFIEHNSTKPLVIRDCGNAGGGDYAYKGNATSGNVFVEDMVGGAILMQNPAQKVFARHYNPEHGFTVPAVLNEGGQYWQLQTKSESLGAVPIVRTTSGGKTEILGTWNLTVTAGPTSTTAAFEAVDSQMSVVANIPSFGNASPNYINYRIAFRETRDSVTRDLSIFDVRSGNQYQGEPSGPGRNMTLYSTQSDLTGGGLSATYFDNQDLTNPILTRVDPRISFDWLYGGPSGYNMESWSARWTGQVQAVETGTYTFRTFSDQGVKLWVNNQLIIDHWTSHTAAYKTGAIALTANQRYDIKVEYFDATASAVLRLSWLRPGQSGYQILPANRLYPSSSETSPVSPTNLWTLAISSAQASLAWTDESGNETGFSLERATTSNFSSPTTFTLSANATSYTNTGLLPGTTYYYRLRATNSAGNSSYSNVISITTTSTVSPAAPSNLTATMASNSQINLSWTDNADNETGFEIERATDAGFTQNLTLVTTTAANATSYSNTGLAVATTYYYRVRATNAVGDSANSNTASATTDSTVISNVIEDAMVRSYDPDVTSPSVNLRYNDRWSYLKFNLAGLHGYRVQSAVLRMYESPLGVAGNTNFVIRATTSAWSEATVTWNTKPTTSSTVFGQYTGGQLTQNQMLDVTLNPAFITGNGTYGLALLPTSGTIDSQFVAIGEAGTSPAQLLLNLVKLTPGDANGDGMVSIADLGTLASNWQRTGMTWAEGDFTGDGAVTIADLGELASNWQAGVPTGPAVSSASTPVAKATRPTRQPHERVVTEVLQ